MTRISEWFGKLDDISLISRGDGSQSRAPVRRWVTAWLVGSILSFGLLAAAILILGRVDGDILSGIIIAVYLALYVLWRRRRNERLTGSPRRWPPTEIP